MMVKYRTIEKKWSDNDDWEPWGAIYENCSGYFQNCKILLMATLAEHKGVLRRFDAQIEGLGLGLADAERMFAGDYAHNFRFRPEVCIVEGESHEDIFQQIWERVLAAPQPEAGTAAVRPAPAWAEYTPRAAYQVLREPGEAGEKEPS